MSLKETILVVNDNPNILRATVRLLAAKGYLTQEAETGIGALKSLEHSVSDLVLLDVNLPDMSGVEVCRRIKEDPALKQVFVVHLSAERTTSDDQIEGLESGADGYIAMPIGNNELVARIRAMMRIKHLKDELSRALEEREQLIRELQASLEQVKVLSGLLPICASCKKIRDDKGYWNQLEQYLTDHTDVRLSHGLCPDCTTQYLLELTAKTIAR